MTLTTDCVTKEFAPYDSKNKKMDLYFRGLYGLWIGYMGAEGALWQCDDSKDTKATCMATMGATMGKSDKRLPFNILDTDYDNYEIYYSCSQYLRFFKYEQFSISARTPQITRTALQKAEAAVKAKIPTREYQDFMKGGDRFYWTEQSPARSCDYQWKFHKN